MIFRERSSLPHMRIARLAETTAVHRAFRWLHLQEPRIRAWQRELIGIPAPPLAEDARAAWFAERLTDLQLHSVALDAEGNASGLLQPDDGSSPLVLLSAHLDTVFPAGTDLTVREEDAVLHGPGAAITVLAYGDVPQLPDETRRRVRHRLGEIFGAALRYWVDEPRR